LAVAVFGNAAADHLLVLPPEVNVHGLLDMGVAAEGSANPLDGLAGLLVVRDDPTMRLPGAVEALAKIETVVVLDNVLHETAKKATVVIAEGRAYASRGTYTQGDFRVQRLSPAVRPEGDAVPCYDALRRLAAALDVEAPADADTALAAIAKEHPEYGPAADLLIGEGVRLNVTPGGMARMAPAEPVPAASDGLRVIAGRDLYTALDAAALRHPEAEKLHRYDRIQVSEEDAARLSVHTGDDFEITDGTHTIRALATVTDRVPEGSVFVSSLLQGGAVAQFFTGSGIPTVRAGIPVLA
jgi:formate dehydrogenase major subunit